MSDHERLKSVQSIARSNADKAAHELGLALAHREMLSRQMAELVRYRDEYRMELRQAMTESLRSDRAQSYHGLLDRLDRAIERQHLLIDSQTRVCDQARCRYLDRQARVQALDQLIQGRCSEERFQQAVREQRNLDDLALAHGRLLELQ